MRPLWWCLGAALAPAAIAADATGRYRFEYKEAVGKCVDHDHKGLHCGFAAWYTGSSRGRILDV